MKQKKLGPSDLDNLKGMVRLYGRVFDEIVDMPEDGYLNELLTKKSLLFYVALLDGRVIGGLTAHVLPSVYFASSEVYVYDFAVDKRYQGQGVGAELLAALKDYCGGQGYREIFIQASAADKQALNFYQKTGGIGEQVFHFSYPLGPGS